MREEIEIGWGYKEGKLGLNFKVERRTNGYFNYSILYI